MGNEYKKHISISQIGTVKRCPRQWVYRYIEGIKSPPGIALIVGSSFDEAYNMNYDQKIESHKDLPSSDVKEKFVAELDERSEEIEDKEEKKQTSKYKDIVTAGIDVFHQNIAKTVQPIASQTELRVPLNSEFDLLGYADVITEDVIIDNKTAGRYTKDYYFQYKTQLEAYVYMYEQLTGEIKGGVLHTLVKKAKPEAKITAPPSPISPDAFLQNEKPAIKFIQALYKDPEMAMTNTNGWWCSRKFCGYYDMCQGCGCHD